MNKESLIIKDASIVNEGRILEGDLLIRQGRIEQVGGSISAKPGVAELRANGYHLLPGFIDDQVHFREPGLTYKGDIATESAAAVAGGITSFMEMPNVKPPTTDAMALSGKYERAAGRSQANFAFYLGATNDNLDEIRRIDSADTCGVKVFMGASTGNMLVNDPVVLDGIFAECPVLIATHCEDSPIIQQNEQRFRDQYGEDVPMSAHPLIRSEEACYKSSALAVELARKHGSRLHVLHLTTAKEMELFEPGPAAGKSITAEVCVHHLYFSADDYAELGTLIKCNPAIKQPTDRDALIEALRADRIDVIATDHAPHTLAEKQSKYFEAPAGLPLVQHALLSLLEHYREGRLSLERIVHKTSHAVADVFGIRDRGYIREGYWADLVLIDLNGSTVVTPQTVLAKCGWSPFDGVEFRSAVVATLVNGQVVFEDGQLTGAVAGQALACNRRD